ncbi:DUF1993 domain-containing protein [Methylovirgula sp. 4M-Z18]|uniref:DUF1993 domain-containing protein n=1 Tax=Methylovirgula sp. 4M-Z18 TaxID=2293567 RepID=UPI000E2F1D43|nr:DUF1993 domain-containing protein [Methylovirgula sp. 4M-Z18]RFB78165.1 DUF1993 domain-containing protein [Methylovirgula sp. 4M-Z18]
MSTSLSAASLPVFIRGLQALDAILVKAAAHSEAKKIDSAVLCSTRLYPDMFAFSRQVQLACDFAKNTTARLLGVDPPRFEDNEKTLAELQARIRRTLDYVEQVDPKALDARAGSEIVFPLGPNAKGKMAAEGYLQHYAMPNFYFHLTTAYAVLRHCGVEIGKRDFIGTPPGLTVL